MPQANKFSCRQKKKMNKETIKNFLDEYFPGYDLNGHEYNFSSPFFADRGKRLYVNEDTGKWYDFHEGIGGSFPSFVAQYLDIPYNDACKLLETDFTTLVTKDVDVRDLIAIINSEQPEPEETEGESEPLDVYPIMFDEAEELDDDGEIAIRYLQERKISPSGLGYFPKDDPNYSGRIFIPFYENDELVYFLARSYTGSELRYKNPAGLSTDVIFNYDKIEDTVFIFEGVFDAMSLDNYPGTAILSNKMKEGQAKKLMGISSLKNVVFVPDKDAKTDTRKLILENLIKNQELLNKYKRISKKVNFFVYNIPDGYKDFNEYKQKSGSGIVNLEDCEVFEKSKILLEIVRF